jgi:DNA-binding transcriptional regulator YbjK
MVHMYCDHVKHFTPPKSAETVAAILRATLLVIAEGGIDGVTHRRVAARAGVSLSSTTYYFANRDELISRAFEHYIEQVRARFSELDQHRPHNLGEVVDAVLSHAQWEFADEALVRAEYELVLYPPATTRSASSSSPGGATRS